ncbi:polysaccharide lyase family 7 protein [Pseudotamlana haliotis]|nr:polysaccharide lyase family 7 protein [Tamlana haliotis]
MKIKTNLQHELIVLFSLIFMTACSASDNPKTPEAEKEPEEEVEEEVTPPVEEEEEITNINWKNWYLSVPIDRGNGSATSIGYEDIVNDNLTENESQYFYRNEDGSYTLYTKFTGFTTSGQADLGGKYCRTELREYWRGNQDTNDNWSMATGTHILESTMHVDFVEGNGRTIVAQIHGKESAGISGNPATVKIRWNSGMIQIDYYTKPAEGEAWTSSYDKKLDFGRVDNEKFTFKIKIENGKMYCALVCEAKDLNIDYTEIYDYVGNGYVHENYFKTGNYFGWHDDYEAAAQVVLHEVVTEHTD